MKKLAILLLLCSAAFADDSPLVKAAKASGGPKKKSPTKVITNADVKKSSGKLTQLPPSKTSAPAATAPKKTVESQELQRKLTAAAAKKVEDAELRVAYLESNLASIEQSYYESDNPTDRDTTIKQRFAVTKQQLDAARKVLADARDEQKKLSSTK